MAVETEVVTKATRRRFTATEKLRVLSEAEGRVLIRRLAAIR